MRILRINKVILLISSIALITNSCFTVKYSTSGASISPDVKTASIAYFQNRAPIVRATLGQQFTDLLREKIQQNTNLTIITDGGDTSFEGEITDFSTSPQSLQSNDEAAKNRLTITIHVKFSNSVEPKFNYDASFSRYEDYDNSKFSLEEAEKNLVPTILDNLVEEIFNKAYANW
jgi:hypothetical protein